MELRRRPLSLLLLGGGVALTAAACIPPRGVPPTSTTTTTTTFVLQEGPFNESEPNNTNATADLIPPAASGFVIQGSQNDSDDPGPGDTDVFVFTAVQDGVVTADCFSGFTTNTTLTITNLDTGATDSSGPPCDEASVAVDPGDQVRITISDPGNGTDGVPAGSPFGIQVTYAS